MTKTLAGAIVAAALAALAAQVLPDIMRYLRIRRM